MVLGIKCYMKAKPAHSSEFGHLFCDYPAEGLPLGAAGSTHPKSFFLILETSHTGSGCVSNRSTVSLLKFSLQNKVTKQPSSLLSQCSIQSKYLNALNTLNLQHTQDRELYCYENVLKMYTLQNLLYLSQL